MPKIRAGNITMNYDQQGSGEPLVLIPYLAADYACYAFQVADYAKHFTCFSIDLRGAGITGESATLEIFTLFGGVELKVPQAWRVVMSGTPILGVFTASTSPIRDESTPVRTLIVRGTAIMGGVEVKN